jgi:hypothetical protein
MCLDYRGKAAMAIWTPAHRSPQAAGTGRYVECKTPILNSFVRISGIITLTGDGG